MPRGIKGSGKSRKPVGEPGPLRRRGRKLKEAVPEVVQPAPDEGPALPLHQGGVSLVECPASEGEPREGFVRASQAVKLARSKCGASWAWPGTTSTAKAVSSSAAVTITLVWRYPTTVAA